MHRLHAWYLSWCCHRFQKNMDRIMLNKKQHFGNNILPRLPAAATAQACSEPPVALGIAARLWRSTSLLGSPRSRLWRSTSLLGPARSRLCRLRDMFDIVYIFLKYIYIYIYIYVIYVDICLIYVDIFVYVLRYVDVYIYIYIY